MKSFAKDMFVLLKEEARILIGRNEISAGWFRLKRPGITVSRETDIVIEGAPSSGNSFALVAFESAQNRRMRIAHHHHLPFQVTLACRDRLPCIVLIRHPLDAVVSRVSRYGYYQPQTLQAVLWVNYSLRHWNMFYERALEWRSNFLVCDFRDLISDYASVIQRANAKFNTEFNVPSADICAQSLSALAEGLKPDRDREVRKTQFKEWMRREAAFRKSLERAEELYAAIHA